MIRHAESGQSRGQKVRLTDAFVERIAKTPPPQGAKGVTAQRIYLDQSIAGFGVRVTSGGAVSFIYAFTSPETGASRRYTIGPYSKEALTCSAARDKAKALRAMVEVDRVDPFEEDKRLEEDARKRAEEAQRTLTFAAVAAEFLRQEVDLEGEGGLRPVTRREYRRHLERHLIPALGSKEVGTIAKLDVLNIRSSLAATPFEANHALRVLRRVLNWAKLTYPQALAAVDVPLLFRSQGSSSGIRSKSLFLDEPPRAVWINDDAKLAALSRELRAMKTPTARVALICLFTGCRKRDALRARWEQFDFAKAQWTVPATTRKSRETHSFPMSEGLIALLQEIQAETRRKRSGWVFPSAKPDEPLAEINYSEWREVCRKVGLEGIRPHDLKRTVVSTLLAEGMPTKLIAAMVGNADPSVIEKRYAHVLEESRRQTLATWSNKLATAERKAEEAEKAPLAAVVPISGGKS